jgi:hypothetical protein
MDPRDKNILFNNIIKQEKLNDNLWRKSKRIK